MVIIPNMLTTYFVWHVAIFKKKTSIQIWIWNESWTTMHFNFRTHTNKSELIFTTFCCQRQRYLYFSMFVCTRTRIRTRTRNRTREKVLDYTSVWNISPKSCKYFDSCSCKMQWYKLFGLLLRNFTPCCARFVLNLTKSSFPLNDQTPSGFVSEGDCQLTFLSQSKSSIASWLANSWAFISSIISFLILSFSGDQNQTIPFILKPVYTFWYNGLYNGLSKFIGTCTFTFFSILFTLFFILSISDPIFLPLF